MKQINRVFSAFVALSAICAVFTPSTSFAATVVKPKVVATVKAKPKAVVKAKPKVVAKKPVSAQSLGEYRGVITGVQNTETFYLKPQYKNNHYELTIKVTPETKFIRVPTASSIFDFSGGDVVVVDGSVITKNVIRASVVKFISDSYKNF